MAIRQDKIQISLEFFTDESKAFAKTILDTEKFNKSMSQAQQEVNTLEKEFKKLSEAGKDTTATELKLAEANQRVTQGFRDALNAGNSLAGLDLSRVIPAQLEQRIGEIKRQLKAIPEAFTDSRNPLIAEAQALQTQIDKNRAAIKGVGKEMDDARQSGSNFFRGLTSFIATATVAFYGLQKVASALFKPSQLASEMEQAMIAFETMLQSARQAKELVNEVIKLAATTPFEQAELIDYTKRLLAMGIETKKLIPTMKSLGDIAAGVGKEKLPQIVLAFGQVATKTKLAGGELKQFTEAGVPLIAALAAQLGKGEKEIFKLTEAGKIGFKDVEKAIENLTTGTGKFAGLMSKQAQTTQGLLSTLKDNVNLALAAFGEGFNVALKEILKSATALTNGLDREKMRAFGESVGNLLKFVIELTPTLLKLLPAFAAFQIVSLASTAIQGFSTALRASGTIQLLFNNGLARTILLQTAVNRLWTTAALPFWGAAIVAATVAVKGYLDKITELTQAQKDLQETQLQGAKSAQVEMQTARDLFAIIRDTSVGYQTRKDAIKKVLEIYPDYLGNIDTEKELLGNLDIAQQRVNKGIIESAFARIKAQEIEKRASERVRRELELQQALEKAKDLEKTRDNTKFTAGTGLNTYDAKTQASIKAGSASAIAEELAQRNKALDDADSYYFKNFTQLASKTTDVLSKDLSPSWVEINKQIAATKSLLAADPKNEGLQQQLIALERQLSKEMDSVTKGDKIKKETPDAPDKDAESKAKKAAKDELDRLRAATQDRINAATVRNLRLGKLEKDFEVELLQIKAVGLQGSKELGIKGELEFLETRKKLFVGEYEKTEAELLKTQRSIRDKQNTEALNDLNEAAEKRQTALELEFAKGEITEGVYKVRSLEISRGKHAEKLNLLKSQGKEFTDEYAKTLLEQSRIERQITTTTLDNSLDGIKNGTAKKLDVLEQEYQSGKISEAVYQEQKLQIIIEGLNAQIAALESSGNKESDLYRQLNLQKIKAQHDALDRQIAVELEGISGLSNAEKDALIEKLEKKRITRHQYDLLILEDERIVLEQKLAKLKTHGDAEIVLQKQIADKITEIKKKSTKTQQQIDDENYENKYRIGQASATLFKDILQIEIDSLSKSTEEKKKNAEKIKRMQRAQLIISSIAEIAEVWKSYASMSVLGTILAGIQTAIVVARTTSGLNQIDSQTFARGGYTGFGGRRDETGYSVRGVVHEGEWVSPKWMTEHPTYAPTIQMLENTRRRGYAQGGYVNTTPVGSSLTITPSVQGVQMDIQGLQMEFAGLREDMNQWNRDLRVSFYRSELENLTAQDIADKAAAAL
jgi:tape measure domain-containing protein